jgi:hypothetical protein
MEAGHMTVTTTPVDAGLKVDRPGALCRVVGKPDDWYPDEYRRPKSSKRTAAAERAIEVCSFCPIRAECLADAMAIEGTKPVSERHGIYGATDPLDRFKAMLAERKGKPIPKRRYDHAKTKPAGPVKERLLEMVRREGSVRSVELKILAATGVSVDTLRNIRTDKRSEILEQTFDVLMGYFEVNGI